VQVVGDLAHRAVPVDVGGEDLAHGLGFGLEDLNLPAAVLGGCALVAVGHLPEADLAGAGAVELAATVALGDLRALVFGDHALHPDQQRGLWVGSRSGALEEHDGHIESREFFKDEDLVGVGAREPVGAEAKHAVQNAGLASVAQTVERGPVRVCAPE